MTREPDNPRRQFLKAISTGCASALTWQAFDRVAAAAELEGATVVAPSRAHHAAKAQQLLIVNLTGGFSHVDTFDPKPALARGETELAGHKHNLLASPFRFEPAGECGLEFSELFAHLRSVADELCLIRSMHADFVEHFQSTLAMHTGSASIPMPSLGSWLSYGLGTANPNLPAYMVLCENLPYAGSQVWDSLFLPPAHQGVRIIPGDTPVPNIRSTAKSTTIDQLERQLLRDVNQLHVEQRNFDPSLVGRMRTNETAVGMMDIAANLFDVSDESHATMDVYGVTEGDTGSFAWQALIARRMLEHGVRVVELIDTGAGDNWDAHHDVQQHVGKAKRVDQPLAALIRDLRQRGMLEQTLIAICTEFGRTPWLEAEAGRGHHGRAFTCLLGGAGVRGGTAFGASDEFGFDVVENPASVHDYHATILHIMGLDHTQLTYRYSGRDFRLTDVYGDVIGDILS